ncbi:type I-F CRISPR-associated endoribonuclease Cas6/Csy4 [Parendozoicomonas sp. Alg238-R29]|uniref:type I-F CRISPR-associated endoribonuclease Cas6/Csy4 n=1 Tax=Parendozoicomonas sp. Alg238-R29 TaxID=2993446 RepID=UPI00248D966E|nr:type I-F CRISPR-associated endoribonuclease Cas6/Csy4 [Parendozoicomonas sp. Alg238-R29]
MQVYIDMTLLPSDDIGHHFLWEKVFQQVHIALVENRDAEGFSPFGITFPEFHTEKHRLGRKLRIFAPDHAAMEKLDILKWLARLTDYVHITSIRTVPENVERFVRFQRLQMKSSPERLIRRAAKRQGITVDEAREQRAGVQPCLTRAPYIWVKSLSSGERFRLFVTCVDEERAGNPTFTPYGLAKAGTIGALPYF